jgi:hypothetical protein
MSAEGSRFWLVGCASLALALSAHPASAQSPDPIKIGVIGEESSVAGASLTKAAVMAANDINAHGGVNGRKIEVITYYNHSSASDSVRGQNNYVTTPSPLHALSPVARSQGDGRRRWHRILFECKRMGRKEVLGRREVLGVAAIDGAFLV